jgi:hypothetical protein
MSGGNHAKKKETRSKKTTESTKAAPPERSEYKYGDEIIAESGKKSRGGLKSLDELYAPGVELVSGDLLSPTFKAKITLSVDSFTLNAACVRLFETQNAELTMDKPNQRLIVFPTSMVTKDSIKFALRKNDINKPRKAMAKNFCALLFHHMEWSVDCRYRIMAIHQELEGRELLVFNLDEAIEIQTTTLITDDGKKKTTRNYLLPVKFKDSFGFGYSETVERKKVDLNDMFLFFNPHTGETEKRKIEAKVPDSVEIVKSNYRPNPEKKKRGRSAKAEE